MATFYAMSCKNLKTMFLELKRFLIEKATSYLWNKEALILILTV